MMGSVGLPLGLFVSHGHLGLIFGRNWG
jgi:hypothetical protein